MVWSFFQIRWMLGLVAGSRRREVGTSGYRETKQQIERALRHLQTDYIDLMLVHWVMADYQGTYQALEEAYKAGSLRAIGLSNFNQRQIQGIMDRFETVPAVLQNEMHIFQQQEDLASIRSLNENRGLFGWND